jgi:hypothetical protein
MKTLSQSLFQKIASALHERLELALETLALRHRLAVLERSALRGTVPRRGDDGIRNLGHADEKCGG